MAQDNLTKKQLDENGRSKWAIYLPAISCFYATFIGEQRSSDYVDPLRFPQGLTDMEQMNWLNDQKALFPYKWSLYSGGHANIDITKVDPSEDMIRNRDPNTLILGDSGGFQIAKGLWAGEWRDPNSTAVKKKMLDCQTRKTESRTVVGKDNKSKTINVDLVKEYQASLDATQKQRELVLTWLDNTANYCMTLDIPTWITKFPDAVKATNITSHQEAVDATKYKKTKIIATIGPASQEKITELLSYGVNGIRLNFSHNTHKWHTNFIFCLSRSFSNNHNWQSFVLPRSN